MLAKRRGLTTVRREVFPTRQGIIATVPRCSFVVRRNTSGHRARGNGEVELTQCVCVCVTVLASKAKPCPSVGSSPGAVLYCGGQRACTQTVNNIACEY